MSEEAGKPSLAPFAVSLRNSLDAIENYIHFLNATVLTYHINKKYLPDVIRK